MEVFCAIGLTSGKTGTTIETVLYKPMIVIGNITRILNHPTKPEKYIRRYWKKAFRQIFFRDTPAVSEKTA